MKVSKKTTVFLLTFILILLLMALRIGGMKKYDVIYETSIRENQSYDGRLSVEIDPDNYTAGKIVYCPKGSIRRIVKDFDFYELIPGTIFKSAEAFSLNNTSLFVMVNGGTNVSRAVNYPCIYLLREEGFTDIFSEFRNGFSYVIEYTDDFKARLTYDGQSLEIDLSPYKEAYLDNGYLDPNGTLKTSESSRSGEQVLGYDSFTLEDGVFHGSQRVTLFANWDTLGYIHQTYEWNQEKWEKKAVWWEPERTK